MEPYGAMVTVTVDTGKYTAGTHDFNVCLLGTNAPISTIQLALGRCEYEIISDPD